LHMCTFTFCGNYRATATERNSLVEHASVDYIRQFVAMPLGEGFTGKLLSSQDILTTTILRRPRAGGDPVV